LIGTWALINYHLANWRMGEVMPEEPNDLMQEGFGAIVWPAIMAALVLGGRAIYGIWSGWQ
jgi:hypothetical protein